MILDDSVNRLVLNGGTNKEQELKFHLAALLTGTLEQDEVVYPTDKHVKQLEPLMVGLILANSSDKLKQLARMFLNKEWVRGDCGYRFRRFIDLSDADSLVDEVSQYNPVPQYTFERTIPDKTEPLRMLYSYQLADFPVSWSNKSNESIKYLDFGDV